VQDAKKQHEVWDKVAEENQEAGVQNASGTFTGNYTDEDAMKRLDPYIAAVQEKVAGQKQVVGVIVAINGKPESMDVFESTPLFRKLWPKLLKSYALDAANEAAGKKAGIRALACPQSAAEGFLAEGMCGQGNTTVDRGVATTERRSERVISFSLERASSIGGMAGAGDPLPSAADASESVHVSAFAH
jgi:hypothetical protein